LNIPSIKSPAIGRDHSGDGIELTAAELMALRPRCNALMLPMHRPAASALAGAYRSRFRGRGVDFVESRNYQPGDDIRNMDWRVTARTGRAHTKVFREERERPVLLVVDASPTLFFGTRRRLKSVAAGYLSAAVAWTAVKRGDRIGAFLFAPGEHLELRPAGGRRGAMRVVKALVEWLSPARNSGGREPLSVALQRVRHAVRPGSLVIIVSDFYGLDEDCEMHISRLRQHNDVVACQVLDPAEEALPAGRFPITDGEQASLLDTGRSGGRRRFEAMSRHHAEDPRRMFQRHQCGWIALHTDDDPVEVLGRELRVLTGRPV
jgi:uncharacterized protein (DUF58 family)